MSLSGRIFAVIIENANMKNCIRYAWAAFLLLFLFSCTKPDEYRFAGDYTFKTGGSLILTSTTDPNSHITLPVRPSYGRLDITPTGTEGRVLLTFNNLGGSVEVFYGTVNGKTLTLETRTSTVSEGLAAKTFGIGSFQLDYPGTSLSATLRVGGTGTLYEGSALLINFDCTGPVTSDGKEYTAKGEDLVCSATRN